jgi:hypothetical protein
MNTAAPTMTTMTGDETLEGTHIAIAVGDDVIIKDVELFTEMPDADGFGEVGDELLREIADATNISIAGGQMPQVILTHGDDAPVVGRVIGPLYVQPSAHSGRLTIFGDLRMTRTNFDIYVRSNDYPRRSAEIHIDTKIMHQLALLGRNNPAAAVRDVYFDDKARRLVCTGSDLVTFQAVLPGAATTPPTYGGSSMNIEDMDRDELETLRAACAERLDAMTDDDSDTSDNADDDDTTDNKDDKDDDDMSTNADVASLTRRLNTLDKTVRSVSEKNAELMSVNQSLRIRAEWRPKLEEMRSEGYTTIDVDAEMNRLASFSSDEQREAHIGYIRDHFKRDDRANITSRNFIGAAAPNDGNKTAAFSASDDNAVWQHARRNNVTYSEALAKVRPDRAKALGLITD